MKLLQKSEIQTLKARDFVREAQEGKKLAEMVDRLREIKAQEEASLTNFRVKTLAKIHDEITQEQEKLATLKGEVKTLEERRKDALKPLDEIKKQIAREREFLDERSKSLDDRDRLLEARDATSQNTLKKASDALERAKNREMAATESLREASKTNTAAQKALDNAKKVEKSASDLKSKVTQELLHRDIMASSRERGITMKENNLAIREAELADGWKLLEDRKEMFERQIKRNKK